MLFERATYKKEARELLKGRRATPVLSTLFTVAISLILGFAPIADTAYVLSASYLAPSAISYVLGWVFLGAALLAFTMLCIRLRGLPAEKTGFSYFIANFSHFIEGTLALVWRALWTGLWSLLFIIPGIVKGYSYSMMFFVLSEDPRIGVTKAMNISKVLTRGYKGDLFVMDLSFIGWHILSLLTCGILYLWVAPYIAMSRTCAYYALKDEALNTGVLRAEDFEVPEWISKNPTKKIVLFIVTLLILALFSVTYDVAYSGLDQSLNELLTEPYSSYPYYYY